MTEETTSHPPQSPEKATADSLGFHRRPMVDWYHPGQLAVTGLRTLISGIFGTYADRRELQSALDPSMSYENYESQDELRIDYTADLGDGWNSTYSVASLLAWKDLQVEPLHGTSGISLPRSELLILGGDEVYPSSSEEEYRNRFMGPYRSALPYTEDPGPEMYAIPGNHDWYDGLTNFLKLFCQGRWVGGWRTRQSRSYFALKLPYNWWLWGIDIQLHADIDKPQLDFFQHVAQEAEAGDRVILCTAKPAWIYQASDPSDKSYRNFRFFTRRYLGENDLDLALCLSGDIHHYASYRDNGDPAHWKITAGGGGAFMHPTHTLPESLELDDGRYTRSAVYPRAAVSRKLAWRNLLLPVLSPGFTLLLGIIHGLFAWGVSGTFYRTHIAGDAISEATSAIHIIHSLGETCSGFLIRLAGLTGLYPVLGILPLLLLLGFSMFSDTEGDHPLLARSGSILHGLIQMLLLPTLFWGIVTLSVGLGLTGPSWILGWGLPILMPALIGGVLGAELTGVYLLVSNLAGRHQNEAFSSLRIQDYKNFLRIHLDKTGLTIYPIGIPRVARRWRFQSGVTGEQPWFVPAESLKPRLIEEPIVLTHPKK